MGVPVNIPNDEYRVATMGADNPATELTPPHWYSGLSTAIPDSMTQGFSEVVGTADKLATKAFRGAAWVGIHAPGSANAGASVDDIMRDENFPMHGLVQSFEDSKAAMDSMRQWSKTEMDPSKVAPLPQTFGAISKGLTVYGMGSLFGGPVGGAATVGGSTGNYVYEDHPELDAVTRIKLAAQQGLFSGLGALLPAGVGSEIATRLVAGAGINAGFGVANRFASSQILDVAGYKDMAAQFAPLDAQSLLADAVLGSAFGLLGDHESKPTPDVIKKALEARRAEMLARGAAGVPGTPEAAAADGRLADKAVGAVLQGKDVQVDPQDLQTVLKDAVVDPEKTAWNDGVHKAAADAFGPLVDPAEPELLEPGIRARAAKLLAYSDAQLHEAYSTLWGPHEQNEYNTDIARSLWDEYVDNPSIVAPMIHDNAGDIVKRAFAYRLAQAPKEGERVVFLAGGGGSGKGFASREQGLRTNGIVYDGTLANFESAKANIDLALKSNRPVDVVFIYREPEMAAEGAVKRAVNEGGRTVPLTALAKAHAEVPSSILKLMDEYKDNPQVKFSAVDNTGKPEDIRIVPTEKTRAFTEAAVPKGGFDEIYKRVVNGYEAAKQAYAAEGNPLGPGIVRGFEGISPEPVSGRARPRIDAAAGAPGAGETGTNGAQRPGQGGNGEAGSAGLDPLIKEQVAQLAQTRPDMDVTLPDGRTVKASDLETELSQGLNSAKQDASLIDTAIGCFLRTSV